MTEHLDRAKTFGGRVGEGFPTPTLWVQWSSSEIGSACFAKTSEVRVFQTPVKFIYIFKKTKTMKFVKSGEYETFKRPPSPAKPGGGLCPSTPQQVRCEQTFSITVNIPEVQACSPTPTRRNKRPYSGLPVHQQSCPG